LLKTVVDAGVPVLVFFAMVVVGIGVTVADFRRIASRPGCVLAALLGQTVLLPLFGWLIVRGLDLHQPTTALGVLLVAVSPSAAIASIYTQVARGNVALSVTLTVLSCLVAWVTAPVALSAVLPRDGAITEFVVPPGVLIGHLIVLLVLPLCCGMGLRWHWPGVAQRHGKTFLLLSVVALVALLGLVISVEAHRFADCWPETASAASLLTVLAFGAGWTTGWVSGARRPDCFAMGMVFAVRNVGIATAVAITVLGRTEFAVFAMAYFLTQVPLLLTAALISRAATAGREAMPSEVTLG
jgi:BASS family bile acid:Na+ symporter